jgi:transaldolase
MDLIANIKRMYDAGDGHVMLLTASVRSFDHLFAAMRLGSDIITSPATILKDWADKGRPLPGADYIYPSGAYTPIAYQELDLSKPWESFDIHHELTDKGQAKFAADWNSLIGK